MKIQILGSGCPTCKKLYEITKKAVEESGLKGKIEYLTGQEGIQKIMEMGVISSPVLVINKKVVLAGRLPDIEEVKKLLAKAGKK